MNEEGADNEGSGRCPKRRPTEDEVLEDDGHSTSFLPKEL